MHCLTEGQGGLMAGKDYMFTSESVTEGHPDKIADQISDAILDAVMEKDPNGRVACETALTTGMAVIAGELSTECYVDIPRVVRKTINEIGYTSAEYGISGDDCGVLVAVDEQSPDIAQGVNQAYEVREEGHAAADEFDLIGAGDQGMVFGYACDETPTFMPMAIDLAHRLCRRLAVLRKRGSLAYLRPDGKSQVTVEYRDGKPVRVDAVVISTQHHPDVKYDVLRDDMICEVIKHVIPAELLDDETRYYINPTGRFVIGGPHGDTGLTGRKIIVDTYGGYARHGGGAYSGKDCTKVDRSGSYAARYAAKNVVAAGLARKCEIQVSYAIGVAHPLSIFVDTFGTGVMEDEELTRIVTQVFDFRPAAIIHNLELRRPIYRQTAAYGHFGRDDVELPWERLDKVEELKEYASSKVHPVGGSGDSEGE